MTIESSSLPPLNRNDNLTPLDVRAAAPYFMAHPQTVYRWIRTGRMPRQCYFKRDKRIWFTPQSILYALDLWQHGIPIPPRPGMRLRPRPRRESFEVDSRVRAT